MLGGWKGERCKRGEVRGNDVYKKGWKEESTQWGGEEKRCSTEYKAEDRREERGGCRGESRRGGSVCDRDGKACACSELKRMAMPLKKNAKSKVDRSNG